MEDKFSKMKNKEKLLFDFYMWLKYNDNLLKIEKADERINEFLEDTKGSHKYCQCEKKNYSVNSVWDDWHCTKCLKPIKKSDL